MQSHFSHAYYTPWLSHRTQSSKINTTVTLLEAQEPAAEVSVMWVLRVSTTEPRKTIRSNIRSHAPLARYVILRVTHAPGMPGTWSLTPRVSDPDIHHGTCVTHVPWCMPGSLTSGFLCSRWQGKRSRHSQRMHNPQFTVSGKRPMIKNNDLSPCP